MKATKLSNHYMTEGDTYVETLTFKDYDTGDALDVSSYTIKQDIRKHITYKSTLIASVDTSDGITFLTSNSIKLTHPASDWEAGVYTRDIKFTDTDGVISTWCLGKIIVQSKKTE